MKTNFTVPLKKIIDEFSLECVYLPKPAEQILISSTEVNRPGLHLTGFFEFYESTRIHIMGNVEVSYIWNMPREQRVAAVRAFLEKKPTAIIVTRNLRISDTMIEIAEENEVPILRTSEKTSNFISSLISYLNVELAPRITRHGVFVEVYGEGLLLFGESGVGKSETAIELVKRGHRLIADDAVEIKKISDKVLIGASPDNIRHFVELRGVGIINARRIFGMGAVKLTKKVDMVIELESWDDSKVYDRMGLENKYTEILDVKVPCTTIPVKTGRNLAVIIEVAAMNNRQKKMGYNAAQELLEQLGLGDSNLIQP
ncbi:MAG: HPr(Ser) kinase/phosphatase [Oscillospiraceae bacterium]|nr:HPr(Ser) kinase/phosphatase [Oscillospiraceae bacterium]